MLLFLSLLCAANGLEVTKVQCKEAHGGFRCTLDATDPDALAYHEDSLQQTGWSKLHVRGISKGNPLLMAYAAGFAEGAATAQRTWQHWQNFLQYIFQNTSTAKYLKAKQFITANDEFVRSRIKNASKTDSTDDYWRHMAVIWAQLDGLVAGNAAVCGSQCLSLNEFLFLQAEQDLDSVKSEWPDNWTRETAAEFTRHSTHCSAIIRLAANNSDLFMGHNTWTGYYSMLRLLKEYDLPLGGADKVVQSGYYGQLYSGDDFYSLSSGLTVQETTNSLYKKSTAELIQPHCVLTWARTILANRLAKDGPSWVKWFSPFNSGTINNQWMIVMMSRFKAGQEIPDGFLTVLEQMPGTIVWADVSDELRFQGHWVSYNSPYFAKIREVSGARDMEERFGDAYSFTKNPRAKIFHRDIGKTKDLNSTARLLRYNNWQHDPLSAQGYEGPTEPRAPENAIAARYDLHPWPKVREAFGNTDAKICRASECLELRFRAISGPTADDEAPFEWRGEWAASPHMGHPLRWDFSWIDFAPLKSDPLAIVV